MWPQFAHALGLNWKDESRTCWNKDFGAKQTTNKHQWNLEAQSLDRPEEEKKLMHKNNFTTIMLPGQAKENNSQRVVTNYEEWILRLIFRYLKICMPTRIFHHIQFAQHIAGIDPISELFILSYMIYPIISLPYSIHKMRNKPNLTYTFIF